MEGLLFKGQNMLVHLQQTIAAHAKHNAFCIADKYYTYGELLHEVGNVRYAIREKKEDNIGLVANDDLYTYASILALWMEGKSYVPLHPHWPALRSEDIVRQVGIKTIIDSRNDNASIGSGGTLS